jgi:hypothetical protein
MSFSEAAIDTRVPDWVPPEFATLFEQVMSELPAFPDRRKFAEVWGVGSTRSLTGQLRHGLFPRDA